MKVFLDANILFSAARSDGTVRHILRVLPEQGHERCVNGYVVGEARRNLVFKSPGGEAVLDQLLATMIDTGMPSGGKAEPDLLLLPEKDRPVLAAAIHARCDALLTGDRMHFGRWFGRRLAGVTVHSPRTLLTLLLG